MEDIEILTAAEIQAKAKEFTAESVGDFNMLKPWDSADVVLALHSANQDVIIDNMWQRFNFNENLNWNVMRQLCIPLWLKPKFKDKLSEMLTKVAGVEYDNAPSGIDLPPKHYRADYCALWYVLLGKIGVLKSLYGNEKEGKNNPFYKFFGLDFAVQKSKVTAKKNGLALRQ